MALYQGSGINLDFYLITTGLNIDPDHGSLGLEYYNHLKNVIQQRAEILFENNVIRQARNNDPSNYLLAYSLGKRNTFQILFGVAEHNNAWDVQSLTQAIDSSVRNQRLNPQDGEYSLDFDHSIDQGLKLYEAKNFGSGYVWVENRDFFYSFDEPNIGQGESGDAWIVVNNNKFTLWYKPVYSWVKLYDWVNDQSPTGSLYYQDNEPTATQNSWWLDTTGLSLRKFDRSINTWGPTKGVEISETEPNNPNNNDLWFKPVVDSLQLFEYDGVRFRRARISPYPALMKDTNSFFVGEENNNNFIIENGDDALLGGLLFTGEEDMVESYDFEVTTNGQTTFNLPSDAVVILDFGVNGIETTAFSYNASIQQLTFNPSMANYSLEAGDKIHILYKTSLN